MQGEEGGGLGEVEEPPGPGRDGSWARGEGSGREEEEEQAGVRERALSAASRDQLTDKYLIRAFTNSHLPSAATSLPPPRPRKEGLFSHLLLLTSPLPLPSTLFPGSPQD